MGPGLDTTRKQMAKNKGAFLCISCYFKGVPFLKAIKEAGHTVFLVTSKTLENEAWPRDHIDEIFYMAEDDEGQWNEQHLLAGTSHLMRHNQIVRVIALDDFDVERAALIREHFRIPGMGQTTARYFRDKLAMRIKARDAGIRVPAFSGLFNDEAIRVFAANNPAPWFIKPRGEASATGIHKVANEHQLWEKLDGLGEKRHEYLIEGYIPGDVFHVDSLRFSGKTIFDRSSQYHSPPFDVAHGGGVFCTKTHVRTDSISESLCTLNNKLLDSFGLQFGASHSEFIRHKETGEFYFLETSSRVGGAHIAEMVEAASGVNLWREWAFLESSQLANQPYELPARTRHQAATIISLSKFEHSDTSSFDDPEIWWRMTKPYHIGFILQSDSNDRLDHLIENYIDRIRVEYHASAPPPPRSAH